MAKAVFNGAVVAESDDIVEVEGNVYFPMDSLKKEHFSDHDLKTTCPWKGEASYFNVTVDGKTAEHGAWYYPSVKEAAKELEGRVAFWNGVTVES